MREESTFLNEPGFIYFVGLRRAFKVGWARDVEKRMEVLQTGSPNRLTLIFSLPGTRAEEAILHRFFAKHRVRGEWFKRHYDMDSCIAWLRQCGSVSKLEEHLHAQLMKLEQDKGKYDHMIPGVHPDDSPA